MERLLKKIKKNKGQALVELLLAIGLAAILIPALMAGFSVIRSGRVQENQRLVATNYLKEAAEALRVVQANGWSNVVSGTYHPVASGTTWVLSAGSEVLDSKFTRQIVISDVYRDPQGNIATVSGTLDPSTKKVNITITWNSSVASEVSSVTYLTRYGNDIKIETSTSDFDAGILTSTQVTNDSGGEIKLSNNNKAKWCSPAYSKDAGGTELTINLPDGPPVAVAAFANASDISIPNDVFVATAPYATSSVKMAFLNVTADSDYPTPTLRGTFTLDSSKYSNAGYFPTGIGIDNNFKTNDVKYYKAPSGKIYALLATNLSDHEVIAVQTNDGTGDSYQDPVNKIYKYWTYFNTKIYNTAFNSPSADAPEISSAGDNNGYQSNPTRAYVNDGSFAVDTNSGSNTGTNCTGTDKDKHKFYNYDLAVPSGASVNGVELNLVAKTDSTTGSPKICVELSYDGGSHWTSAKSTGTLTTSSSGATYVLGGSSDNWGRSWNYSDFSDSNFRVRVTNVASNTSRDFSLDWVGVKVYYNGISTIANDAEPFGYGARSVAVMGDTGYVTSGGYLYSFDLSNIDSKSPSNSLDQQGCRIQLDGYDCSPGTGQDKKYGAGQTGSSYSDTTSPAHNDCSDGGNIELYADNDIYPVSVGGNKYIYVAVGAGTNPEFEIVNVTSVPDAVSSPSISSNSCGRVSGGNNGWKVTGSLDFNPNSNTEEAANSVFASADGTRAYISSNGGIDGNGDGIPDSDQFYILNTSNKSSPVFLSTWASSGTGHQANTASSGYYNGSSANLQMHPRRSLTVLNGQRVVLVGKDAIADSNNAYEYQVLNNEAEATPAYCGGVDFNSGFNDLTYVSEADGDNFVYMVANTQEKQLKIIQGGADSAIYSASGVFESQTFDAGADAMFNRFSATTTIPANTSISFQVAVQHAVNGSCSGVTYNYVGPDGTSNTFFTEGDKFPIDTDGSGYENPGQCMRYKAFLTSSTQAQTPVLSDISINYSQ